MTSKPSPFAGPLEIALRSALSHLGGLDHQPAAASATLSQLRARLAKPLNDSGISPEVVITDLVRDVQGGLLGSAGGRFFAWAIGGSVPAALAADWLTSAWDQNAALFACGPSAAIAEEVAGEWLKDLLGLPTSASFAFVSGCQMAHVCCLAAARHALLLERGWNVEREGLCGAPPLRILASNRHGSVERAVRLLGLGEGNVLDLDLDRNERVTANVLRTALETAPGAATVVLLQAGDLNTGAFDDYREVIPIAKEHGAWVHVDGAFGLWAGASPHFRNLLDAWQMPIRGRRMATSGSTFLMTRAMRSSPGQQSTGRPCHIERPIWFTIRMRAIKSTGIRNGPVAPGASRHTRRFGSWAALASRT